MEKTYANGRFWNEKSSSNNWCGGVKGIQYTTHIEKKGKAFFKQAEKKGLEGIIAKRADSVYQGKRGRDWLKIKTHKRQEVVIGGFTKPKGARKKVWRSLSRCL